MITSIQNTKLRTINTYKKQDLLQSNIAAGKDFTHNKSIVQSQSAYAKAHLAFKGKSYEELFLLQKRVEKLKPLYRRQLFEVLNDPSFNLTKPLEKTLDGLGKMSSYISQNTQNPHDYLMDLAKKSQIIMLGEEHSSQVSKAFTAGLVGDFKKQGYNFAAVELDFKYQNDINEFLSGKITSNELINRDKLNYQGGVIRNSCGLEFLKECKKHDVKVVCMDDTEQFVKDLPHLLEEPEKINNKIYGRDGKILKNLETNIFNRDKDSKVLIYVGEMHTLKDKVGNDTNLSLRMLLDNKLGGDKVSSVSLLSKDLVNTFANIPNVSTNVAVSTHSRELDDMVRAEPVERFLNESGYVYYNRHIDGMVILDETTPFQRYDRRLES